MAFERTPFDTSDTGGRVKSRWVDLAEQREFSRGLAKALEDGRRGIFLLGAQSAGAGKSTILDAAVETMGCFPVWIRPDEHALDEHLNLRRIVRMAMHSACDVRPGWFDRWADQFLGKVFAVGLRAGLIPSQDAEAWARVMEETPGRYLGGSDGADLLAWLASDQQSTLRYQIALRMMSSGEPYFDEVDEVMAWMNFFLSDRPVSSIEWLARWMEMGNRTFAGAEVKFTRQTLALVDTMLPVVCLFDQVDGVTGRPELAREVARTALDWRHCTSMVVIAVNRDVWEIGFLPALPEAWSQRLSACSEWLGDKTLDDPKLFQRERPSDSATETNRSRRSGQSHQADALRASAEAVDSQPPGAGEPGEGSDFLVYEGESNSGTLVDARRALFRDAGNRLPFVTVEPDSEEDRRLGRVRWNTPEHVAWIGLAESDDKIAWQGIFSRFAASSMDEAAVKFVIPLFDDESEPIIRAHAASQGLDPSHDGISWLHVSRLTPAGWWRSIESHNHSAESFIAGSPLWSAITAPVVATS